MISADRPVRIRGRIFECLPQRGARVEGGPPFTRQLPAFTLYVALYVGAHETGVEAEAPTPESVMISLELAQTP
jgi:hypothetical protein